MTARPDRAPDFTVTVTGTPGPQGSKTAGIDSRTGRMFMGESSKKVAPWRRRVVNAAKAALPEQHTPLDGPLHADMVFSWPRPKNKLPKERLGRPTTPPDLSKLLRSTEDALTTAGVWADDARVVSYGELDKRYTGDPHPDALAEPGAVIRVWKLTAQEALA